MPEGQGLRDRQGLAEKQTMAEAPDHVGESLPSGTAEERTITSALPGPRSAHFPGVPGQALDDDVVLSLIRVETARGRGIGRASILKKLKEEGYAPSDFWLRQALHRLASRGLIVIGTGRAGCRSL